MAVYFTRGIKQELLTRNHHRMIILIISLEKEDGLKLHNDESVKELEIDEVRGPLDIKHGDKVLLQDYIKGNSAFWLIGYYDADKAHEIIHDGNKWGENVEEEKIEGPTVMMQMAEDLRQIKTSLKNLEKMGISRELMELFIQKEVGRKVNITTIRTVLDAQKKFFDETSKPAKV